jgi:hypothetical protein
VPAIDDGSPPITLHDVFWNLYQALLDVASAQRIRLNYEDGDLEIMPPPELEHETSKCLHSAAEPQPISPCRDSCARPGRAGVRRVPARDSCRGASRQKSSSTVRLTVRARGET